MILAHSIRLDPTPRQEAYFRQACGVARFAYNWALAAWKVAYEAGEKPNGQMLRKRFNAIRRIEYPWTYDVHRDCTSRAFDDLQSAFQHFFRRVKAGEKPGYPKFKKKGKSGDSFYVANDLFRFDGKRVRLPKISWIKMREALRFEGKVMGAAVSRRADQWHIAVQIEAADARRNRVGDAAVGVDLGIKASATLSTGEVVEGPKALVSNLKRLQRLSRRFSKTAKGSKRRQKAAMRLARLHLRIANIRKDHLHKLSTRLCRENQAVGIEDLNVAGMIHNRKLSRSIGDEGWGQLREMLTYKAEMYRTEIVIHYRFFPSSKTCSGCGHVKDKLPLSTRIYRCSECGLVIDRDLNAALNLEPKLGQGMPKVKPGERKALAEDSSSVKPASVKRESSGCQPERVTA